MATCPPPSAQWRAALVIYTTAAPTAARQPASICSPLTAQRRRHRRHLHPPMTRGHAPDGEHFRGIEVNT